MALSSDAVSQVEQAAIAMGNSPPSAPGAGSAAGEEDAGPSITVNTKAPASFPPPKTDKPRPHVCGTCQRSFARLEHLKRHERSHTKEKPFECPECTRCFARRDLLLRHQQKLHQTTTPSSRPRNRRESSGSTAPQSRARKNSMVAGGAGGGLGGAGGAGAGSAAASAAAAAASMRPRANTISHVDHAAVSQLMAAAAANANAARGFSAATLAAAAAAAQHNNHHPHSRHPSLAGLPLHAMDHHFAGMASAMGQRGINPHGLPKLETHGIGGMDFGGGGGVALRTAPPLAVFNHEFDLDNMFYGHSSTINPNALHYSDSPQSMAIDAASPFSAHHGASASMHDLSAAPQSAMEESFEWLSGFEAHMSFGGANEHAVDGSSPSAISTTSQSGISDVMVDGSNHRAAVVGNMWPHNAAAAGVMGPPHGGHNNGHLFQHHHQQQQQHMAAAAAAAAAHAAGNPFGLDLTGGVFPDLLGGAPVSPQPQMQAQKNNGMSASADSTYFTTPPPSLSSLSPSMLSMNPQNLSQAFGLGPGGPGPETPPSTNGSITASGPSPVSTITEATRAAILNALSSQCAPFGGRRYSFASAASSSPMSPHFPQQQSQAMTGQLPDSLKNFPSTADLQRYVGSYLRYFHPHMPFLHVATLNLEMPAPVGPANPINRPGGGVWGGSGSLTLSMAAVGALYELEHARSRELFEHAKKMIQLYLEERRKADLRKADYRRNPPATGAEQPQQQQGNGDHTPVWLVQAMLLNIIYGHNCGDRTAGDIASTHCTALVNLAKAAELLKPARVDPLPAANADGDVKMEDGNNDWSATNGNGAMHVTSEAEEQAEWLRWKSMEERKRTLYALFIMSSMLVSAFNHSPAVTNSEVNVDLPCDEEFFTAESAAAFAAKGGIAAANHNRMTFHEALGELLRTNERQQKAAAAAAAAQAQLAQQQQQGQVNSNEPAPATKSDLHPSTFGCLVLIHALHNYIWETRQRHHAKVWTNEETDKMHRHIEPALKAWQAAWAANPHHSCERPNPYGKGPLSADAIPLLDLAYVRLFVNLARSKERFWQRDWEGMADELGRGAEMVQHAEQTASAESVVAQAAAAAAQAAQAAVGNVTNSNNGTDHSTNTDASSNNGASSVFGDSPAASASPSDLAASTASLANGNGNNNNNGPSSSLSSSQMSSRGTSRRERHLRKAAFYAADSLSMSDKLGVTFADFTSRELPLQSAMCAFDCAQVLAEWVATLQDRVGRYLGVLGQDDVDLAAVPAIMLLEEEDVKLIGKIQEVLGSAEMKMNMELISNGTLNSVHDMDAAQRLRIKEHIGYAAKILRITSYMLDKAAVWPVTHLMARCLEAHGNHMRARAEKSVTACE